MILIYKGKTYYQIYNLFRVEKKETLSKLEIKGNLLIFINGTNVKATTYTIPNIFPKIGIYRWLPAHNTSVQHFIGGPGHCPK